MTLLSRVWMKFNTISANLTSTHGPALMQADLTAISAKLFTLGFSVVKQTGNPGQNGPVGRYTANTSLLITDPQIPTLSTLFLKH